MDQKITAGDIKAKNARFNYPYAQRESEYHREKRTERYWTIVVSILGWGMVTWFIVIPLTKYIIYINNLYV